MTREAWGPQLGRLNLVRLTSGDDQRQEGRESGPTGRLVYRLVRQTLMSELSSSQGGAFHVQSPQ